MVTNIKTYPYINTNFMVGDIKSLRDRPMEDKLILIFRIEWKINVFNFNQSLQLSYFLLLNLKLKQYFKNSGFNVGLNVLTKVKFILCYIGGL